MPKFRLKGAKPPGQRASMLRAISTPTRNDTLMRENVTFNISGVANCTDDLSLANLSAIPILSPPSPERIQSRRNSKKKSVAQNEEIATESFRFRHGKKDKFEEMVRRGSKNHEGDVEPQNEVHLSSHSETVEKQLLSLRGDLQNDLLEHHQKEDEDGSHTKHKGIGRKSKQQERGITKMKPHPGTRSSKRIKQTSEPEVQIQVKIPERQQEDIEDSQDLDDFHIQKPCTKSPFKAVRGEGNSFHGWNI